jgi:hypothetical protein
MTALPFFEMLQPRVDHFFHPMQFSAPRILRVIKSLIDGIEPSVHVCPQVDHTGIEVAKPRVINKDPHQYGDRGNSNGKCDLNSLIGHRSLQNTPSVAHNQ